MSNKDQDLRKRVLELLAAYRKADKESDQSDFLTKAEVIRSIRDSCHAIEQNLRRREDGIADLLDELEKYSQTLQPDDLVQKFWSGIKLAYSIMGGSLGIIVAAISDVVQYVLRAGAVIGRSIVGHSILLIVGMRILYYGYNLYLEYSPALSAPSNAQNILSSTVDPAENKVYALIGKSRPARTFELAGQGGALLIGVVVFLLAWGILWGVLQAFQPPQHLNLKDLGG